MLDVFAAYPRLGQHQIGTRPESANQPMVGSLRAPPTLGEFPDQIPWQNRCKMSKMSKNKANFSFLGNLVDTSTLNTLYAGHTKLGEHVQVWQIQLIIPSKCNQMSR